MYAYIYWLILFLVFFSFGWMTVKYEYIYWNDDGVKCEGENILIFVKSMNSNKNGQMQTASPIVKGPHACLPASLPADVR